MRNPERSPTAALTRSPMTCACSRLGCPSSTTWAESARTSLDRLQQCRSWTSVTPWVAEITERDGGRRRGRQGVASSRTPTLARTSRQASAPMRSATSSATTGSSAHETTRREYHRPGHDDPEGGCGVAGEMQGHGPEIEVAGRVAEQQGRGSVSHQAAGRQDHHQPAVHMGRVAQSR